MRPLTVGIVGAGGISSPHADAWTAFGADLHVLSVTGASALAAHSGGQVAETLDDLLERVDAVDICAPTPSHAEIAAVALRAGKDVVCEKPLTRHVADACRLVELAESLGRRIYPAHVVRYFQEYAAAKAAVDAGRIGEPAVLRFTRTGTFPRAPWFADEAASGGIVMDQMIHDLDQAAWLAGPVESVYAMANRRDTTPPVQVANVTLTHVSGAISHCRGVWGATGTAFRYTFHLSGTGGVLSFDSQATRAFSLDAAAASRADQGDGFLPSTAFVESPYSLEIADFAREIQGGATARVSAREGLYAVELAAAALESLRAGRTVDAPAPPVPAVPSEV